MIFADMRDYKNGFVKHKSMYDSVKGKQYPEISRNLLLFYAVENGLKYLLLRKWKVYSPTDISNDKNDDRNLKLYTHKINVILKELGKTDIRFPVLSTIHGDIIEPKDFHELCRYGIRIEKRYYDKYKKYEIELNNILKWLQEEIV